MRSILFLVLTGLAIVQPLGSTTLLRYDLEALTEEAERVVVGTCQETRTDLVHGQVYTRILFAVNETIKGNATERIVLHLPGGHYQGHHAQIVGMPAFSPGEEAILFLTEADLWGYAWPVGLAQGKFRIQRLGPAAKPQVFQELDGLSFYAPPAAATAKKAPGTTSLNGLPLDQFLSRVRMLVPPSPGGSNDMH